MSGFSDFDEASLNAASGLSSGGLSLDDDSSTEIRLHADDRAALDRVAAIPPTGVTPPAAPARPAVPEYLASYMPAPASPDAVITAPDPVDYAAKWKEAFGDMPAPETGVDRESFENQTVAQYAYNKFIEQHPDLDRYRAIAAVTDEQAATVLSADVEASLRKMRLFSKPLLDSSMAALIGNDGQLTAEGQSRLKELRDEASGQVTTIEEAAKAHSESAKTNLAAFYQSLNESKTTFNPFGIKFDEATLAGMVEDVRSGKADQWLNNTGGDIKEAVEKSMWLALISDPERRAELARLMDSRGQEYGRNRRLAASA